MRRILDRIGGPEDLNNRRAQHGRQLQRATVTCHNEGRLAEQSDQLRQRSIPRRDLGTGPRFLSDPLGDVALS